MASYYIRLVKNYPVEEVTPGNGKVLIMENLLLKKNESKIEQRCVKCDFCDMNYLLSNYLKNTPLRLRRCTIHIWKLSYRMKTKIARHHKEEWYTETADGLYCCTHYARKLAVHKDHKDTRKSLYEVKEIIILHSP